MNNQTLVANLYNPHEQTKEQLIQSFVVRRNVFKKLFKEIKSSDMKHPEQHFLIVGQRGMGKTTLLLRLGYEVENDNDLNSWLISVVLKEESYWGITRLFKLWETVAKELEIKDKRFLGLFARMEAAYTENDDYERIIFDILIQELQTHSQKMLLFIDNLAEMFRNFSDMECHRLREILMTCPHLRMIGATAIVLEAFFTYEHAFYEFFKKEHLEGLNKEETRCLLEQLAKSEAEQKTIRHILEHQQGRAEALRIMTGGVLRTIILLFEIFIDNENGNAIGDLESILDRVTPLYKHRMDDLAPMQREVVNAIALNWDAVSIEEIAKKMRMKADEITPILQGLDRVEIIQRAAADTQLNLYFLKERFFNIWYLMRVAPKGSQNKVIWLVRFLESWYDKDELIHRAKRHIDALCKGDYHPKGAYYLTEALAWTGKLDMDVEHELIIQTRKFLEGKNESLLADLSSSDKELVEKCHQYGDKGEYDECLDLLLKVKNREKIYTLLGIVYFCLKKHEESEKYCLMAVENGDSYAMALIGCLYEKEFKNTAKAEKYYSMAVKKGDDKVMDMLGEMYKKEIKDYNKAKMYYLMAIEKGNADAMRNLGLLYENEFKDNAKAEKYYLMAVEKGDAGAMNDLAWHYCKHKIKKQDALKYAEQSFEKDKDRHVTHTLACIYVWDNKIEQAIKVALDFMFNDNYYKSSEKWVIFYLMLLLAKEQYQHVTQYFEDPELNLKERFKPLYYALLHFTDNKDFHKMPPELAEPVKDIIEKVKQMAVDYA